MLVIVQVVDKTAPDCNCALRSMHYYDVIGQSFPDGYMRLSPHTDITCITLLFHRVSMQARLTTASAALCLRLTDPYGADPQMGETGLQVCPGREATTDFAHGDTWYEAEPIEVSSFSSSVTMPTCQRSKSVMVMPDG